MSGAERTKERLIEVALELFQERGYSSVTVQDIVEAMGASKGAFYYHWSTKEELLYLIHDQFITYETLLAEPVVASDLPPRDKFKRIVIDLLESIARYKAHVTVFFRDWTFLSEENLSKIKAKRDHYEQLVTQVIREGIECGQFRSDVDPKIAVFALFGMCNWTYQWYKPGGRLSYQEIAQQFLAIYLDGISAQGESHVPQTALGHTGEV